MLSVNTNNGAMVALQTLNKTNSDLAKTQNAISTGLKVASAKDNGAIWAIANKMKSDVGAYDRVRESTDRAASILDTGIAAGESIMELLNEMKGKALAGSQAGLSASAQAALAADFLQLRDQITSVIANASFDGSNMIAGTPNNAVALGDAAGGKVYRQIAQGQHRVRIAGIAPRDRSDPGGKFCQIKGFDQIVICAGIQPLDPV